MDKLAYNQTRMYFYSLGVKTALSSSGRDKTAGYLTRHVSRLAPMGAGNIAAGAGHLIGGGMLGGALGAVTEPELIPLLSSIGALAGKIVKDRNTRRIAENLGFLERRAVAKALGKGVGGRVGGALLSGVTSNVPGILSEALTNSAVRRKVGLA